MCIDHVLLMAMDKAVNILGALAMVLSDEVRMAVDQALGTTGEAGAAIIMLGAHPGLLIGQIAEALGLSHSGCVRLIDRLESEGVAQRRPGRDHRSVSVELTKEGARRRGIALKQRELVLGRAVACLSSEEQRSLGAIAAKSLSRLPTSKAECYRSCRMCDEGSCVPLVCPVEQRWAELFG